MPALPGRGATYHRRHFCPTPVLCFSLWSSSTNFQAVSVILHDEKLNLEQKSELLKKFNVSRLIRPEEERLMRLILFDSRFLAVKRDLISRYHFQLNADQKKKLKSFILKSQEVSLDVKRSIMIEFRLGALTADEKEVFRHQILKSMATMEEKRVYLIEFGIIRDSEAELMQRGVTPILGDDPDDDEEGPMGEGRGQMRSLEEVRHDDPECKQRIRACFKVRRRVRVTATEYP